MAIVLKASYAQAAPDHVANLAHALEPHAFPDQQPARLGQQQVSDATPEQHDPN